MTGSNWVRRSEKVFLDVFGVKSAKGAMSSLLRILWLCLGKLSFQKGDGEDVRIHLRSEREPI